MLCGRGGTPLVEVPHNSWAFGESGMRVSMDLFGREEGLFQVLKSTTP
jgi:hypothetical protein